MNKPIDLIGHKYHRLKVVAKLDMTPSGARLLCMCECGGTCMRLTTQLRRKSSKTNCCPECLRETLSAGVTKHGGRRQNTRGTEPLYAVWKSMRARCADASNPYYGGKGVRICAEWRDYDRFRAWALANGYESRPELPRGQRLSIERINPDVGYCPENCEWITGSENSRRMVLAQKARKEAA